MNEEAQQQVMAADEPRRLLSRHSDLLYSYGVALAVEKSEMVVPGGNRAFPIWQKLAGASPQKPARFISALLSRDEGKLLAYYHAIPHLPAPHQRFFTKNASRLAAFYNVFPYEAEKEALGRHAYVRSSTYFNDLAREVPLDEEQNIVFPGSANVWMVAKGRSKSIDNVNRLLRRVAKVARPDVEDEILLKMLETRYSVEGHEFSQVENFLAVVRLEQHRTEPMDEQMALLLSQNYAKFKSFYPYFASLPLLTSKEITRFLQAAEALEMLDKMELNTVLGEFDALIHLLVLLRGNGAISDAASTKLFASICGGFAGARRQEDYVSRSLETIRNLLSVLNPTIPGGADRQLMHALSGNSPRLKFSIASKTYDIDRGAWRRLPQSRAIGDYCNGTSAKQ